MGFEVRSSSKAALEWTMGGPLGRGIVQGRGPCHRLSHIADSPTTILRLREPSPVPRVRRAAKVVFTMCPGP